MIELLAAWITGVISAGGYAGVAALMALESACIPLPSEVIMPFAGYLTSTGRFSLLGVALAGAIGCNIGSTVAYWIGATGGRRFVDRYGGWVLLDHHDLDVAERFFARFGTPAVLIGRVLPVVRTFIALPAGMARMRQLPFQLYTFVGSFVWCYALAKVGDQLGRRWDSDPRLRAVMHQFQLVVLVVLLAAIGLFLWHKLRRRRRV
ncbi:DedA family protein [Lichenicoccus roseus]|nr:DedA family protein [Lichenicoccus roseus]